MRQFLAALLLCLVIPVSQAAIVGGSDLLGTADAAQLEAWLGQGPINLTNIFDKGVGDTAPTFHAAVNGQGATFSVIEVLGYGNVTFSSPIIIGGYNPQSWSSNGLYNQTPNLGDRTAFLFNLTASTTQGQRTDAFGEYQTYNYSGDGPTFGAGFDLVVTNSLASGTAYGRSYGVTGGSQGYFESILGPTVDGSSLKFGQIEVFSVSAAPVPLPAAAWLLLSGLGGLGVMGRRRKTA